MQCIRFDQLIELVVHIEYFTVKYVEGLGGAMDNLSIIEGYLNRFIESVIVNRKVEDKYA